MQKSIAQPFPQNFWIEGGKGLGKTMTAVNFVLPIINNTPGMRGIYIPITKTRVSDVINDISLIITQRRGHDIKESLDYLLKDTSITRVIFIFDDVQQITHIKRDFSDVLFQIHEYFKPFMDKKTAQVLLISRLSFQRKAEYIDDSTLSRMQFIPVMFSNYRKNELIELYKQRITYMDGGTKNIDEICTMVANEVFSSDGDFRYGLEIIKESLTISNPITIYTIEDAIDRCKLRWWQENIFSSLKPQQAFMLYWLAQMSSKNYKWRDKGIYDIISGMIDDKAYPAIAVRDLEKTFYEELRKMNSTINPYSPEAKHMNVCRILEALNKRGLIDNFNLSAKNPYNYTKKKNFFVRLLIDIEKIITLDIDWVKILT